MLSTPPAMYICPNPALIFPTACEIASNPEAQYLLIVIPGTSFPKALADISLPI